MKTIETTMTVLPDGSIQIPPRPDLTPGEHRVVLVIDQAPSPQARNTPAPKPPLRLKMLDTGAWPEGFTVSREEIYDDDGR
jgi:hypothetical protein